MGAPVDTSTPQVRSGVAKTLNKIPKKYSYRALSVILAIVALVSGEVIARNEWVSSLIMPAPSAVWNALSSGFSSGLYYDHILSTLSATAAGFVIAATVAILTAGILAGVPLLEAVLLPFVIAFQTLPKIAIAPLVVLWLGFGQSGKIFIVSIVCFFPILINTLQGLRIRERDQYELMQSMGASRWQLFRYLRAPNAVPYIFAGLHIGAIFALIGAVVAEFVGSRAGLGFILLTSRAQFNVPGVFAILVLLMLIGLTLHGLMLALEKKVAFWASDISAAPAV